MNKRSPRDTAVSPSENEVVHLPIPIIAHVAGYCRREEEVTGRLPTS